MPGSLLQSDARLGYVHSEAPALEQKLRNGDGIVWPGDPRLSLAMGVVIAEKSHWNTSLNKHVRRGDIIARRYEVRRFMEDGSDQLILAVRVEEFDMILLKMAEMRLDAPGHVSAMDRITKINDDLERKHQDEFVNATADAIEHMVRYTVQREHGRHRHYMNDATRGKDAPAGA